MTRKTDIYKYAVLSCVVIVITIAAYQRNEVFSTPLTLWQSVVRYGSSEARVYNNLGNSYLIVGQIDDAVEAYRTAVKLDRYYYETYLNLLFCCNRYEQAGAYEKAMDCFAFYCDNAPPLFAKKKEQVCIAAEQMRAGRRHSL